MAISNLTFKAPKVPWQTCAVCHALDTIPDAEADALRRLLSDKHVRYSELSAALADDPDTPLDIDALTLSRHARGRCAARERLR